jgi:hypothetical protein
MAESCTGILVIRTTSDFKIVDGWYVDNRTLETIELVTVYDICF